MSCHHKYDPLILERDRDTAEDEDLVGPFAAPLSFPI